ncbi:MAG: glycosyltransferase [Eubacteriales bacterium]|nr:glycosyltransferase [Eubacteriales bacterium]
MEISVCIPMYNESERIADTARELSEYMAKNFSDYEILFSDDGSTDGCADIVRSLELPCVRVVGYRNNRGKGCAVRTAFLEAHGDFVMFTDADLAYGTEVIRRAYDERLAHPEAGLVIGSRNLDKDGYSGYTFLRRVASKAYIFLLGIVGGFRLSDSQCGCKGFTHDAVQKIFPRCEVDGFAFDFEAILWAGKLGIGIVEMPVKVINHGTSKVHVLRDSLKMLKDLHRMKKRISKAEI